MALQRFIIINEHGAAHRLLLKIASQKPYVVVNLVVDYGGCSESGCSGDGVVDGGVNGDGSSDDCGRGHWGNDGSGCDGRNDCGRCDRMVMMVDGVVNSHGGSDSSGSSDDSGSDRVMMTVHDFWKGAG